MRYAIRCLLGFCIFAGTSWTAHGQGDGEEAPVRKLTPPLPGAKPLEVKERIGSFYSAVSKLKNTDTRDGIGVRWNWPKELVNKDWGANGALSLVAFPNEHVAFGKHRGLALRLVNRGKEPAVLRACDSALYIVQEARDDTGRWREIENVPCSKCGNSYHNVALAANEYWEFSAPEYAGAIKTKIRFRLDARKNWIYSNEFNGQVAKELIRMAPTQVEIFTAFASKNAKEQGVLRTLVELLAEDSKEFGRSYLTGQAVEHLAELGPAAKSAAPALRKLRDEKKGALRAEAAYAVWRLNGDPDECVKTLLAMLNANGDESARADAARFLWQMGPAAKDAVPDLCRAIENGDQRTQEMAIGALGGIRARADIAVPALVKALKVHGGRTVSEAARALSEFGVEAKPALPQLNALVKEVKNYDRVEVAYALWKIEGKAEQAVPILIEEVKSGQAYWAAERLGDIGPPAKAAVPELTRVLKNDDYGLIAARALWKITGKAEPSLSTSIRALQEKDSYRYPWTALGILEDMGPQAKAAVPALLAAHQSALKAKHESLLREIESALQKIDPAAAKKLAPIKVDDDPSDPYLRIVRIKYA